MLLATILTILVLLVYGLIYYISLPTLSLAYFDGATFFSIGVLTLITIFFIWKNSIGNSKKRNLSLIAVYFGCTISIELISLILSAIGNSLVSIIAYIIILITFVLVEFFLSKFWKDFIDEEYIKNGTNTLIFTSSIILVFMIIGLIASSALFHAEKMYNQLGKPEEKSFKEDLLEVDTSQIPVVDIELADILGDKKLGEELALGSQAHVGQFTNKQAINGKLFYVAPLEHSGIFKWFNNTSGTTGFIKISATNSNDVELVRNVNLKYINSAYFGDDLVRHLRFSGYATQGLTEFSFELDDTNKPHWVVTTYSNTTFWDNPEATGVIICDPQTGECDWYSIEDTPAWVDIIQPESFIINQIQNFGKYVHGIFNFSDKDKLTMTEHITTVYNDGECYYYTGLSSSGVDNSTVGFILVNTRDKSSKLYRMVGATESSAMSSAEGKVQNMEYTSTTPIPLNISGVATYFSTLKDSAGLIKSYALVNIEDYSIVATGNSIMEAKRAYINNVNNVGQTIDFSGENNGNTQKTGTVTRIGSNIENGNTYYYFMVDNDMTKLYLASYTISEELPLTREGDIISFEFSDTSGDSINLISFNNLNVGR